MDTSSSIDHETSTNNSISTSTKIKMILSDKLCRVGSGSSVVLDSENGVEAESRKLPSSQYKGVVPQPNGRWGAQIYEKHQRVWLGTFNEEKEAAKAYDIAVQRYRGRDAITNFKPLMDNKEDQIESAFLSSHSKLEIVDMLRKHTYSDELEQSKRRDTSNSLYERNRLSGTCMAAYETKYLFEKAVTPSDVGKLNRLVIPKQHAEKHFPLKMENSTTCKGTLLNFEDKGGKVWRFRYSYWNSSQSYVLTKGWSRFVKEKKLQAGDVVSFLRSLREDKQLYIDWKPRIAAVEVQNQENLVQPVEVIRLFGVNIFKVPVLDFSSWNGKRRREEMEFLSSLESSDYCKKQCL